MCCVEKAEGTPAKWLFENVTNLQSLKGKSEFSLKKKKKFGPNRMNTAYTKTLLIITLFQKMIIDIEVRIIAQIILYPLFRKNETFFCKVDVTKLFGFQHQSLKK